MQNRIIILLIISAMFFCCGILRAFAFEIDFDYFYDKLEPYGEWIEVSPYGWVWTPDNVSPGWRPYTSGYWIDSDYGCFFASDDDYGWAVYHYGRWEFNDDNGWIWIPDTVWGPGWVAWRCNDEFIGWAPLPWLIKWLVSFGIRARDFDIDRDIIRSSWCFVGSDRFFNRRLSDYVENPARNVTIIKQTRNYTNYSINNKRIVNNSINISDIERVTRRKVEKYHIADAQSPDRSNNTNVKSNEIRIYKPDISSKKPQHPPVAKTSNNKTITADELKKQQEREKQQLNDAYDKKMKDLQQSHQEELKKNTKKMPQPEIERKHKEEEQALKDMKDKESKVLDKKHKRKADEHHGR